MKENAARMRIFIIVIQHVPILTTFSISRVAFLDLVLLLAIIGAKTAMLQTLLALPFAPWILMTTMNIVLLIDTIIATILT
jgi:putative Ca2+/H+ antiporter (TMEM165/GDT1 family)